MERQKRDWLTIKEFERCYPLEYLEYLETFESNNKTCVLLDETAMHKINSLIKEDEALKNQEFNNRIKIAKETTYTDINKYLADSNNIKIYESLTSEKYKHLFEPLEFFNYLYSELNFYRSNSENYLIIKNHFEKPLFYNEYQNLYFYCELNFLISVDFNFKKPSEIQKQTRNIILELFTSTSLLIQNGFDRKSTNENLHIPEDSILSFYSFDIVTDHLKTLPDNFERLKYLINKRTYFLNNHQQISTIGIPFNEKCDNEMDKIKELIALDKPQEIDKLNINSVPFKVLLLFAENKIYSKVITIENIKATMYYYLEQEFENPNQLANHLKLSRQYINDTFKNSDTNHNLYKSKVNMINVYNHCKENDIYTNESFSKKYSDLITNQA